MMVSTKNSQESPKYLNPQIYTIGFAAKEVMV